jgi:DNA-binding GntR family transcriptional regulator
LRVDIGSGGPQLSRMTDRSSQRNSLRLYEIVRDVLRRNIDAATLPAGLVLLEGPIAEIFEISRAPVQRALQMLETEGVIHRFDGRGYLVGPRSIGPSPIRDDIRDVGLDLAGDVKAALQSRSAWERIYGEIEHEIASCMAFGRYRIIESSVAEHFGVSRTVVRDVLGRLQERGLVEKDQSSHWVVGPLTAKTMREFYEIRRLLEPPALRSAAPNLDRQILERILERIVRAERAYPDVPTEVMLELEEDLHVSCVLSVENARLASFIQQSQLPLLVSHLFHRYLGTPEDGRMLAEHRLVVEHLLFGAADAAAAALSAHLDAALLRGLGRLKVLAVIPAPDVIPSYLVPANW